LEKVFENIKKKLQFTPTTVSMIRDFMLSWWLSFTDHSMFLSKSVYPVLHSLITKNKNVSKTLDSLHCEPTTESKIHYDKNKQTISLYLQHTEQPLIVQEMIWKYQFYSKVSYTFIQTFNYTNVPTNVNIQPSENFSSMRKTTSIRMFL
jgi:hypothetical protein